MYQNILVPVAPNHPANAKGALDLAQFMRAEGGKITVVSAIERISPFVIQYLPDGQTEKNWAEVKASLLGDVQGSDNVEVEVMSVDGSAGHTIVEYAKKHKTDLIVIISHQPGLQDYFLGSTAARVVRHAPCAVHVVR